MYCIIKCSVQGKQARVKNADLCHLLHSCNVKTQICVTRPQCVKQFMLGLDHASFYGRRHLRPKRQRQAVILHVVQTQMAKHKQSMLWLLKTSTF